MKIALLGSGKTGSHVAEILGDQVLIFNRSNPATLEMLASCDAVISFLPGDAFVENISLLLEANLPVVTGSTGFEWKQEWIDKIERGNVPWVYAHNFSLGMNIVKLMIEDLSLAVDLLPNANCSIHEVHHTKKIDAPSGTALAWQEWMHTKCEISSDRSGDVVGFHHLTLDSENEKIELSHEAKDRAIFAQGAIWAAKYLIDHKINSGLYQFNELVRENLSQRRKR